MLFHLPIRYEDRTRITPIADLLPEQYATIEGVVQTCEVAFGRRPILTVSLSDGTSKIMLRFFNFNAGMKNSFQIGMRVKAFGEIKRGRFMAEIHHPEYQSYGIMRHWFRGNAHAYLFHNGRFKTKFIT